MKLTTIRHVAANGDAPLLVEEVDALGATIWMLVGQSVELCDADGLVLATVAVDGVRFDAVRVTVRLRIEP